MPGRDETAPIGRGPITGRGLGPYSRTGTFRRRGLGYRRGLAQTDKDLLIEQKELLQRRLDMINKQLGE